MSTDPAEAGPELIVPAGRLEGHLITLILAVQAALVMTAAGGFGLWLLIAPTSNGDWLLYIPAGSIVLAGLACLLTGLYRSE